MKIYVALILHIVLACTAAAHAQHQAPSTEGSFDRAANSAHKQLQDSLAELSAIRDDIAKEKVPLSRKLSSLEQELTDIRREYQQVSRLLDNRSLDLNNLRTEIKSRHEERTYLSNLLAEYIRNFESRLHIAELQRYRAPLDAARLAADNNNLADQQIFETQVALVSASLQRLHDALGGTRFDGTAVDPGGVVRSGTYTLVGPAALFRSADGQYVGTAEQRLGSLEPTIVPFAAVVDADAATQVITFGRGQFPLDPTLGNAHKIEATQDTLWAHIRKGGPVMVPIFALATAAFLVVLCKWIGLMFVRIPSRKRVVTLLNAVARRDRRGAAQAVEAIPGPTGAMLAAGVEHLDEPRDLIEEVMFEKVLATRLKLQRWLPFIAISAAAAPLLGLLGTVTGIINTFKLITVFGTGDVKTLSGGISEALITTEFGLIVAIPSLLLHALLSRKARGVIDQMEKAAVALVNQVAKAAPRQHASELNNDDEVHTDGQPALLQRSAEIATTQQVREILADLLVPAVVDRIDEKTRQPQPSPSV